MHAFFRKLIYLFLLPEGFIDETFEKVCKEMEEYYTVTVFNKDETTSSWINPRIYGYENYFEDEWLIKNPYHRSVDSIECRTNNEVEQFNKEMQLWCGVRPRIRQFTRKQLHNFILFYNIFSKEALCV